MIILERNRKQSWYYLIFVLLQKKQTKKQKPTIIDSGIFIFKPHAHNFHSGISWWGFSAEKLLYLTMYCFQMFEIETSALYLIQILSEFSCPVCCMLRCRLWYLFWFDCCMTVNICNQSSHTVALSISFSWTWKNLDLALVEILLDLQE